jgi:beta-glucanase (GH16 family)
MRRFRLSVIAFVAAAGLLLAGPAGAGYRIVWEDDFDGTSLDPQRWEAQIGTGCPSLCGWGNGELQYYRAENATVSGGFLTITAKEEAYGGRSYTSARLRTKDLGDWRYGRFEMRAKLPIGQGLWPAFWMLPTDEVYGGWPYSGEIDILEYVGQSPSSMFGTIHYGGPASTYVAQNYTLPSGTFHDEFHTFALEWEPNEMRWAVDGVVFGCNGSWFSNAADASYPAPFDQPFHLLLNLAVGGNLPGPPDGTTVFPQELVVDWVRVWQRPDPLDCCVLFDGMDHDDPFHNRWFVFNGVGGGGIQGNTTDLPPTEGCGASLEVGWGGSAGLVGGFGRTNPVSLEGMTHFSFWIHPDAGQSYTLEINLQDDDDGDNSIPGTPDGADDEFQYDLVVSPTGPGAVSGGGWQKVTIPLSAFFDDGSYHWGGNGVLDAVPTSAGGNGQLINVVFAIVGTGGGQTFRTDRWEFTNRTIVAAPQIGGPGGTGLRLGTAAPNPFARSTRIDFALPAAGPATLSVYDVQGRMVQRLVDGIRAAGSHAAVWDGRDPGGRAVSSGVYFVRLEAAGAAETRKLVLRR